jgi:type IV fimbrial biogenesis protein FimT
MLRHRPVSGLTLIELLIGIALLAVLLGLAAPGFEAQIAASQLSSASNALMGGLMQARAQAIRLGRRVTVCRTSDQQQCDNTRGRGWETGWLIFIDVDRPAGNAQAQVSATDTILARNEAVSPMLRIRGNQAVDDFVSFSASGEARTMAGSANALGTIRVCSVSPALADAGPPQDVRARDLVLAAGGRVVRRMPAAAVTINCPAP